MHCCFTFLFLLFLLFVFLLSHLLTFSPFHLFTFSPFHLSLTFPSLEYYRVEGAPFGVDVHYEHVFLGEAYGRILAVALV